VALDGTGLVLQRMDQPGEVPRAELARRGGAALRMAQLVTDAWLPYMTARSLVNGELGATGLAAGLRTATRTHSMRFGRQPAKEVMARPRRSEPEWSDHGRGKSRAFNVWRSTCGVQRVAWNAQGSGGVSVMVGTAIGGVAHQTCTLATTLAVPTVSSLTQRYCEVGLG
jgi:hypothetical protein